MALINVAVRTKEGEKQPTRYYSSRQEKAVSKAVGAALTKNSGATFNQKGDALTEQWLLECKTQTKDKDTFTIRKEWFEKNDQEALFMGKPYSAVVFNFGPDQPNRYVIDENLFKELQEYLQNK